MCFSVKSVSKLLCTGCEACVNACPRAAIKMRADKEGFLYPEVHANLCISCGVCLDVCIVQNTRLSRQPIKSYAARADRESVREISSSGGVFFYLAKSVLEQKGIVFGVVCNKHLQVKHFAVDSIEQLKLLCGSKYVQSKIGSTYNATKVYLEQGKSVLFSGTPCQIAALKSYLGKSYSNLLCVDLICHGVPSPFVFKTYISNIESNCRTKAYEVSFRYKKWGWKDFSLLVKFENGNVYTNPLSKDMYLKGFVNDLYNRPSCHNCLFKHFRSDSDITLGDYWNVHKSISNIDDNMGVSAVMINSEHGSRAYNSIVKHFTSIPTHYKTIASSNLALLESTKPHKNRSSFFNRLQEKDLANQIAKALKPPMSQRIHSWVRFSLKRVWRKLIK